MLAGEQSEEAVESMDSHNCILAASLGIIPGAGQLYNGQPLKALCFASFAATTVSLAFVYKGRADDMEAVYYASTDGDEILAVLERHTQERNRNYAMLCASAGISMISALDAWIYGWKKEKQLEASVDKERITLGYSITF